MSQGSASFGLRYSLLTDRGLQRIVLAMRKLLRLSSCHSRALEMNVS
jgi:hypothetical protein